MDIQKLSMGLALQKTQEQAAVQVQRMALNTMKEQGAALMKLLESDTVITDPNLGNRVNILV
jgi:hypothetical protein